MTSERTELYGKTDFLANCGGLLGLFLGASVISFLEIVYFSCIRLCFNRKIDETRIEFANNSRRTKGFLKILRTLIADYFEKTTIQGIKYIAHTKLSRTERFWWTIIVAISVICCGSLISNIFRRYRLSPVTINLAKDETPISSVRKYFLKLSLYNTLRKLVLLQHKPCV
jgi:Amiloride-sensitive sodium channel